MVLPVRKSEKKSLVTYLFPHQRGNTAGPLQIHLSERAEAMLRCRHCCCGYRHTIAHDAITLVCVDTARCLGTL